MSDLLENQIVCFLTGRLICFVFKGLYLNPGRAVMTDNRSLGAANQVRHKAACTCTPTIDGHKVENSSLRREELYCCEAKTKC